MWRKTGVDTYSESVVVKKNLFKDLMYSLFRSIDLFCDIRGGEFKKDLLTVEFIDSKTVSNDILRRILS